MPAGMSRQLRGKRHLGFAHGFVAANVLFARGFVAGFHEMVTSDSRVDKT